MEEQLILKNRIFLLDRNSSLVLAGLLLFPILILLPVSIAILEIPLTADTLLRLFDSLQEKISEAFREEPVESTFNMLVFLSFPACLFYMYLASRNEQLILTPAGIRYVSPFPEPFDFLRPGWFIRWDQIKHARFEKARYGTDVNLSSLSLTTRTQKRRLRPAFWVNPHTWKAPTKKLFGLPVKPRKSEQLDSIMNADLVSHARRHFTGIELEIETGKQPFNLADNPWSVSMSVALLLLLGYALVDTFILKSEAYAGNPPVGIYAAGGLLIAGTCFYLLVRAKLPLYVSILLPAMAGLAFAAALHPALLRINQLTDKSGHVAYVYLRQPDGRYLPEHAGPPPLSIHHPTEYWAQFTPDSTYMFELRKGGLGFWQLNEAPLLEAYRDYFKALHESRNSQ